MTRPTGAALLTVVLGLAVQTAPGGREVQNASIGRAVWRRDGFVSLTNGALPGLGDPGTITTKPLEPAASVLGTGALAGKSLDALAGQQIKLGLHLAGGDLYSFWFAD